MSQRTLLALAIGLLSYLGTVSTIRADKNDWAEGRLDRADGATRDFYNRAARLPWNHFMGDWRDRQDTKQGDDAYATAVVEDKDQGRLIEWDVTELVREWQTGAHQNQGFFIRATPNSGIIVFQSRECDREGQRPQLELVGDDSSVTLAPAADTFLAKSTYRSHGDSSELRVSSDPDHLLIRFDLDQSREVGKVSRATLRLYTTRQYGDAQIGVFRCRQGTDVALSEPIGTYCYHAEMATTYGDVWGWTRDYRGFLANNRWYCIEQYLHLNTPGEKDGVLRAWVDGRLAFEKTDIRFRDVPELKIEQIWMNVYHGGTKPSPYDQHLYIDNVVIATEYIGPLK